MKKFSLIIISLITLYSCGNSDRSVEQVIESENLSQIREKKAELSTRQSELSAQIAELDAAIQRLDGDRQFTLVRTREVNDTVFKHYIELPGDVETDQNVIVYPEFSGVLSQVMVREGDRVQKGQVLARIDDGGLSSQVAQLETQAALAKTTFERQERLWEQRIGSEIQFLEAKANFEAVQNSVNQLKSQLAKTVVKAPFSGIVDEAFIEQGEVVAPGQSRLFRIINLGDMYVSAAVPESYLGQIEVGTQVLVQIAAIGVEFESQIRQVGNFINPNNRTFEIKVDVPADRQQVKPNLIATVKLNDYTSEGAITIPESVIQQNSAGENVAFVLNKQSDSTGVAERRVIRTGYSYEEQIEVLEGIRAGETLITEGSKSVRDGQQVKILNQ